MTDSIIGAITEFIGSCPLLEDGVLRVDAMGDEAIEYTVETVNITLWTESKTSRTVRFMKYSLPGLRNKTVLRMFRNFRSIAMRRKLKCFPTDICLMGP